MIRTSCMSVEIQRHKDTEAQRKAAFRIHLFAAFLCASVSLCLCVFHKTCGVLFVGQQRLHFASQVVIPSAHFVEEGRPLGNVFSQDGAVDLLDLLPTCHNQLISSAYWTACVSDMARPSARSA